MKVSKAVIRTGLKVGLAYRFDFLVSVLVTPISVIIFYFLWKSIYEYSGVDVINGFTFSMMVSYYVINMIVGFFTWSNVNKWIEYDVIHGDVIATLLKPLSYFKHMYFFELGINMLAIVLEAIPVFIIGFIFFNVILATPINTLLFAFSLVFASWIFFLLSYLIGLSSFWLNRISGISRAKKPIIDIVQNPINKSNKIVRTGSITLPCFFDK